MFRRFVIAAAMVASLFAIHVPSADAVDQCVTGSQMRSLEVGQTVKSVKADLGTKGVYQDTFKWQLAQQGHEPFPVRYSMFRDFDACNGADFRVEFDKAPGERWRFLNFYRSNI